MSLVRRLNTIEKVIESYTPVEVPNCEECNRRDDWYTDHGITSNFIANSYPLWKNEAEFCPLCGERWGFIVDLGGELEGIYYDK